MSNSGQNVQNEAIREVAFGSINATYDPLGAAFLHDVFLVSMFNDSDANMYLTVDGATDQIKVAAQSGRVFDYKTNDMYRKKGTQFSIRYETAPTLGGFWLEVEYT